MTRHYMKSLLRHCVFGNHTLKGGGLKQLRLHSHKNNSIKMLNSSENVHVSRLHVKCCPVYQIVSGQIETGFTFDI